MIHGSRHGGGCLGFGSGWEQALHLHIPPPYDQAKKEQSILLCSSLSSTASSPHLELLWAWWQQGITSILVNKAGPAGRLSHITIHMVPAMDLASTNSCSQTKYPRTGQEDSMCQGPLPGRILNKAASGLGPFTGFEPACAPICCHCYKPQAIRI